MKGNEGNWVRAIRGPITLITLGMLFVLNNFTGYGFDKTWPVLLIVFGLLSLLRRSVEPVPPPPVFPPPNYTYTPPPPPQTSYSGSSYSQPPVPPNPAPSSPFKGGFGGTAPKPVEPNPPSGETL